MLNSENISAKDASTEKSRRAAIAAHRFGLGEASLGAIEADPTGWLESQIGPADAPHGEGLLNTSQALAHVAAERQMQLERRRAVIDAGGTTPHDIAASEQAAAALYREIALADARSRLLTAAMTTRPFAERLQWFWSNHFTVSLAKGSVRGLVGAFERDAIRPRIAGSFEQLLVASTTHPAMLRYLDNLQSAGPNSPIVARAARRAAGTDEAPRVTGLNENLAREVLELHTLGAESARGASPVYTQADVTALARVLTGWRGGATDVNAEADADKNFDFAWHEPGPKTLLGKTYPPGTGALRDVLHDLAQHPATAHFIATKLARHFVADDPPPALVERLENAYLRNAGQLAPVYRELIASPLAWRSQAQKLKTPEEFVVSSMRLLALDPARAERLASNQDTQGKATAAAASMAQATGAIAGLGQRVQTAPSPAGWSDRAEDWLGPDAVWKRIEWATRTAGRFGNSVDARTLAAQSLGSRLSIETQTQLDHAADGPQALALLLMAPEFQRR